MGEAAGIVLVLILGLQLLILVRVRELPRRFSARVRADSMDAALAQADVLDDKLAKRINRIVSGLQTYHGVLETMAEGTRQRQARETASAASELRAQLNHLSAVQTRLTALVDHVTEASERPTVEIRAEPSGDDAEEPTKVFTEDGAALRAALAAPPMAEDDVSERPSIMLEPGAKP